MITALDTPRINRTLLIIAAAFVACSFALWTPARGLATAVGAGLAVLNFLALRWLGGRIVNNGAATAAEAGSQGGNKAVASSLLMGKIGLLMGLVYVFINRVQLDPIGLAFGLGVMFVGPVVASLMAASARPLNPSAATAAREE